MTAAKSKDAKQSTGWQHVEPLALRPLKATRKQPSTALWVTLFFAATLGLGAAATWLLNPSAQDHVSASEVQQRAADFARMLPVQLKTIPASELDARLAGMQLAPAAQTELKQLVQASLPTSNNTDFARSNADVAKLPIAQPTKVRLVELTLWDSQAPDGDVVRVVSAGYSRDVILQKQPLVMAVPVQGSAPIQIIGVHDGGGGITLAVQGAQQPVMMPIMSEGQTMALPIAP